MNIKSNLNNKHLRSGLFIFILALALFIIIPQFREFNNSWRVLANTSIGYALVAFTVSLLTYLLSAITYKLLSFKHLRLVELVLVQLAAMFINKLLPSGIGAIGANYSYLKHKKHSTFQTISILGLNNILGLMGHLLVIFAFILLTTADGAISIGFLHSYYMKIAIVLGTVLFGIFIATIIAKKRAIKVFRNLLIQLNAFKNKPYSILAALTSSIALTLANIYTLYYCSLALNVHLPILIVLIVFTIGLSAGTALPTPGGAGGFEIGIVAALVSYHVPASNALALALLFRLISFWIPLLIGFPAFILCQHKKLFSN